MTDVRDCLIVGAGPAGLTAGYVLAQAGLRPLVLESDPVYVGGISRTVSYHGYLFDIGGHRFFSKSDEINRLWTQMLPEGFIDRPRSSKIYYRRKFFAYPLRPLDALLKLGPIEAIRCIASYVRARTLPVKKPRSFEDWVSNEFGYRLFRIFFKTYTEKVWGIDCSDISADWASQRIKGLSLGTAIAGALHLDRLLGKPRPKTYIDSFRYPSHGPGMLWSACAERIRAWGGAVQNGRRAISYERAGEEWIVRHRGADGDTSEVRARHVISSAPLRDTCRMLQPPMSAAALAAADRLSYRDFVVVIVIINRRLPMEDQWIYIHDPGVKVGRIQNFAAWSPMMVPRPDTASLGLEYFSFDHEPLWAMTDQQLVSLAASELEKIGLAKNSEIIDACVVRQPKAYPVYDHQYHANVDVVRRELETRYPGFQTVGRNGMHKYNNQDHAMMTGLLAARNILAGRTVHDPWRVNIDAEYHEESSGASGERLTPTTLT